MGRRLRSLSLALSLTLSAALPFAMSASRAQTTSFATTEPPALIFTIDVKWNGTSAYRLERDVTTKIENAVSHLPGVRKVHSTTTGSRSQTSVFFDPNTDASSTASAIRARLDQIRMRLPRDASQPLIAWHREPATDR